MHPEKGFTCALGDLKNEQIIDAPLASGNKNGYVFELVGCKAENPDGPNTQYHVIAYPITKNTTGIKAFCSDETDVVRYDKQGSGEDCMDHGKTYRGVGTHSTKADSNADASSCYSVKIN